MACFSAWKQIQHSRRHNLIVLVHNTYKILNFLRCNPAHYNVVCYSCMISCRELPYYIY
uniref:Uncharacterized protein n=1 Tax=Ciona intestinalis TaxID=7719 RepID=H2XP46_CIOIN